MKRILAAATMLGMLGTATPAQTTTRISVATGGAQGDHDSRRPAVSSDGRYVAFGSLASGLVAGDTNGVWDVFIRDTLTGQTGRVSTATGGAQGNRDSTRPSVSSDGRYVAFESHATNLVAGDTNSSSDIFVHDRQTEMTGRVSIATGGGQANANSLLASISGDGRYIAFQSFAANLVAGDTNGRGDIFVHDRQTGQTSRVSTATGGAQGNGDSFRPIISSDGRYVAFGSRASNLVAGDTNARDDIFIHDRQTGQTSRVSIGTGGAQGNGHSSMASVSSDGRYIAFHSLASNLVPGDTNGRADVFVHDRQSGETSRISVSSGAAQGNGDSESASISADGRCVAFRSAASNLVSGDGNGVADVFLHDRQSGETIRVSLATGDAEASGESLLPSISGDGRVIAFESVASDLAAGDTNGRRDIFLHDRMTPSEETTRVSVASLFGEANNESYNSAVSADGRFVAFECYATNLVPDDTNGSGDIFVLDRETGETSRVSVATGGAQGNASSAFPAISADGRYVAFHSFASNLVAGDTNGTVDVFVHDRQTGETSRVSVATGGAQGNNGSRLPAISADGRFVAFESFASNLVAGDTNGARDIFVHDRQTGETSRVSVATGGAQGNASSAVPAISADGRFVAFESLASNLVAGDSNGTSDVFVHDRQTGETSRVSVATGGAQGNTSSAVPAISADGRFVAFQSDASNLVAGDTNAGVDIFVHDRQAGETSRVSVTSEGGQASYGGLKPSISGDGRFVAFESGASDLVPGDTNDAYDIFVHDRQTGTTTRVSVASDGAQSNGDGFEACISADGRFVAFESSANNLIPADSNSLWDVFGHDRISGQTTRISIGMGGGDQGNGDSVEPSISADGRFVAFHSDSTTLVPIDTNGRADVFVHDRQTGATSRVSVSTNGGQGNNLSFSPSISSEGRLIAFSSSASNLVFGDSNNEFDVFVHDRVTRQTTRISLASDGAQANGGSFYPRISSDGRYVVFESSASNLVPNDTNNGIDIFVHDRQTGETSRVNVATGGGQVSGASQAYAYFAISADGRFVTFYSPASGLVAGDTNGANDVFVHDRQTVETTRVSIATNGAQGNGSSFYPSISSDGRFVAFQSQASNLVLDDTNGKWDVFIHDRQTGQTARISVATGGLQGNDGSHSPAISGDGRFVAFESGASNLVPGDTNGQFDVFVHDRLTGETARLSVGSNGAQGNIASYWPAISSDGRCVAFWSFADNLVPGDTNGVSDIFVRSRIISLRGTGDGEAPAAPPPPPPPPECPGDANGDGMVSFSDITSVLENWGADYTPDTGPGDANGNGFANFADVAEVLINFGATCW